MLWLGNNLHNDVIGSTRMWQTGSMTLPQTDNNKYILRLLRAGEFSQEINMPLRKAEANGGGKCDLVDIRADWVLAIRLPARASLNGFAIKTKFCIEFYEREALLPSLVLLTKQVNAIIILCEKNTCRNWHSFQLIEIQNRRSLTWKRHKFQETRKTRVKVVF